MNGALQRFAQTSATLQRQIIKLAVMLERPFTAHDVAHDVEVFAGARQWLGVRLAIPTFDHLRARSTEPKNHATVRQMVECHGRHCSCCRCATGHLHDAGAELNLCRLGTPPCEWCECIAAVSLSSPQ